MLLYGMFAQIPFLRLYEAIANRRFIAALLTANFVAIPTLVWLLTRLLPSKLPLLLGVYLVLLTPCIDYVVVFTHLGKGNARLVLASTPLLLFAQMLLLPAYLWFFLGEQAAQTMGAQPFVEAFLTLIVCHSAWHWLVSSGQGAATTDKCGLIVRHGSLCHSWR